MSQNNPTADSLGYGFAAFRSHALHRVPGDWYAPGRSFQAGDGYHDSCSCGRNFYVSEYQHYHDNHGVCHTLERCA